MWERRQGGIEHEVTGGMTRPKDEMGSQIVSSESNISHPILVYLSRNNNYQAQARRFPALTAPEPEFPVIFGSKWDPLTSAWRQGGASPERLAELPTDVSPLQKRIRKRDFYHCSSCNFFFHICFCHLWCELPFNKFNRQAIFWTACLSMGIHVFFLGFVFFFARALVCSLNPDEKQRN